MSELPKGWANATIGDVTENISNAKPENEPDREFAYIDIGSIDSGMGRITDVKRFLGQDAPSRARRPIKVDDVLFSNVRTYLKNIAFYDGKQAADLCSTGFTVLRTNSLCLPKYLYHWVRSEKFIRSVSETQTGTHYPATSDRQVKAELIPLAPLNEQKRIVAKLDEMLPKVEACKQRLEKIPTILKRFRQSVLAAAVSGKLTEEWRSRNACTQTATDFVASLKTEQPADHLSIFVDSQTLDLPASWVYAKYGRLGKLVSGGTPSRENLKFWGGDYPWVSPKDMKRMHISSSQETITEHALKEAKVKKIPKGSILMVVRGMILNHTLPVAILDRDVAINQDIKALIPAHSDLSEYLIIAMTAIAPRMLFEIKEATHGTRRLETEVLVNFAIPIPPLEEQREIVRLVQIALKDIAVLTARAVKGTTYVSKISDGILSRAFNGVLLPQDPKDEPASTLLERLKISSKQQSNGSKPKRTRKIKDQDTSVSA